MIEIIIKKGGYKMLLKSLKKSTLLTIVFTLVLTIFTLPLAQSVSAQEANKLRLTLNTEPPSLDPALATDSTSGAIIRNVFEGLTTLSDGEVAPGVAESWELSDDLLTYTFKLREDATWTNGQPVTAHDFEYAWKRVLNPETASSYASILYVIDGAKSYNSGEGSEEDVKVAAIDDHTLEVTLTEPCAYFLELTAFYTYLPVNKEAVESGNGWAAEAGEQYVTNGPFTMTTWNHNSEVILTKNPTYWDADNVSLEEVNIQIITSEATATAEYQAGNLDYLGTPYGTLSLDSIDLFKADGSMKTEPYAGIYMYKLNTTDELIQNVNLRKALALAIDRQSLIDNILKGNQIPALGYVPATIHGFEEDRGYFQDGDFEAAKEYLAKAMEELGLSDPGEITIKLSINDSEAHMTIAQYVQESWAKNLGIQTEIDSTEWQVYLNRIRDLDYQVGRLGWIADYNDPNTFLEMYKTADDGNNNTGWESPDFAEKLTAATKETDPEKRTGLLLEAESIMIEDMPVIPVYYYTNNYVVSDHVQNMKPDALGGILLKDVVVE